MMSIWIYCGITLVLSSHAWASQRQSNAEREEFNSKHQPTLKEIVDTTSRSFDNNQIDAEKKNSSYRRLINKHPLLLDWTISCGQCDPELCDPTPADCPNGLIRDACDCCYVCGNLENTLCDLPDAPYRYGQCSDGLICTPSTEQETNQPHDDDGYCACALDTVLCGNDNKTYLNPCQFQRAIGRKRNLRKVHEGPCVTAPSVEIPPMNESAEVGSSAVFSCTVSGFPFALFEWFKDGESVFQPDLSEGVTVQIRSGPLKYQVTTWLEIKKTKQTHEGLYTCKAKNSLGEASASAQLEVIEDDYDLTNHLYVFRGKHYQFSSHTENSRENPQPKKTQLSQENTTTDSNTIDMSSNQTAEVIYSESDVVDSTDLSLEQTNSTQDNRMNDKLVETLKELVKPKEFKDIFFDDDDLSEEGSGE